MKIRAFHRWYDMWVGAYYDRKAKALYLCLLGFGICISWGKPTKLPAVGAAALVLRGGHLLMAERRGGKLAGWWACPGGHVEWRETAEDAAIRELKEETGMTGLTARLLRWDQNIPVEEDHHYVVALVLVEVPDREDPRNIEPEKSADWEWVDIEKLPEKTLGPIVWALDDIRAVVRARRPLRG